MKIGAPRFELGTSPTRTVRATRLRHAPKAIECICDSRALDRARVIAVYGGLVGVAGEDGEQLVPMRGALRRRGETPVVGDYVAVDADGAIAEIHERSGVLQRAGEAGHPEVLAAHVDVALLVTSLNRDLNMRRLERFLSLATDGGIPAVILLTKADLHPDPFAAAAQVERAIGTSAVVLSVLDGWGVGDVAALVEPGQTGALIGTSGVGKSTLLNALLGEDRQQTLPIREKDDRGRHATTRRELFRLPTGAFLIDTPGVRIQRVASADGLDETFDDITQLAAQCRFADCTHTSEPMCAVQAAIESGDLDSKRLDAFRRLQAEARWAEERQGGPGDAARRARGRAGELELRRRLEAKRPPGPAGP